MDLSAVPVTIKLSNTGDKDVGFRFFRVNFVEVLKPSDTITIAAQSSEEAAYYLSQNDAKVGLKAEVVVKTSGT